MSAAVVMAPVSPAVADLLHQLQGQIIREAAVAATRVDERSPTLVPIADLRCDFVTVLGDSMMRLTGDGYELTLYRDHTPPERGGLHWHPAHWWGSEDRCDSNGIKWSRCLPKCVCDDFGNLVPIEGAR